jgi:SDR family mycofactocin-dependent oxidoreductase
MMGRVDGKVALVTGGARGQGRSHAVTLAREGARLVVTDICEQIATVQFPMGTQADLDETVRLVEEFDQPCIGIKADARSAEQMQAVADRVRDEFGRIDILAVNHGITHASGWENTTADEWRDELDTNLLGVWNTVRPVIPSMIEQRAGSIVFTASVNALAPLHNLTSYTAAKHGVIGLMRGLSADLGQYWIRVNAVCPGVVDTPMNNNDWAVAIVTGGREGATWADTFFAFESLSLLPAPVMPPEAISNAVLFLASDESKWITGVALPVDMGQLNQPPGIPLIAARRIAELEHALAERP